MVVDLDSSFSLLVRKNGNRVCCYICESSNVCFIVCVYMYIYIFKYL